MKPDPIDAYRSYDVAHEIPAEADERIQQRMYAALESNGVAVPGLQLTSIDDEHEPEVDEIVVELDAQSNEPNQTWRRSYLLLVAAVVVLVVGVTAVALSRPAEQVHTDDSKVADEPAAVTGPDVTALTQACSTHVPQLASFAPAGNVLDNLFQTGNPTVAEAQPFLESFIEGLQRGLGDETTLPEGWTEVAAALVSVDRFVTEETAKSEIVGNTDSLRYTLPRAARQLQDIADQLAALGIEECTRLSP